MFDFLRKYHIKKQVEYLKEPRPLPIGRKEFEKWSKEILEAASVPGLTTESGKFALAEMIFHVKPQQSFECYGHFVHSLRKGASNETAMAIMKELKDARTARGKAEPQIKAVQPLVSESDQKVLEDDKVQNSPK